MHRIFYAGHSIVTGTSLAHALLDYAQALAFVGGSATIEVPTIHDDGSPGRAEVLVGPSSQLMSDAEESDSPDVTDPQLVEFLQQEASNLRTHGIASTAAQIPESRPARAWDDFDL